MRIGHDNFIRQGCRRIKGNFNKHFNYGIADKVKAIFNQSVALSLDNKYSGQKTIKSMITALCSEMEKRVKNNKIFYYEKVETNHNYNVISPISARELKNLSKVSDVKLYKHIINYLNIKSYKELFVKICKHNDEQYDQINLKEYAVKDDFIAIVDALSGLYKSCDDKLVVCEDLAYLLNGNNLNKTAIYVMIANVLDNWSTISDMLANNGKSFHY